jgi:arylsulfatase
LRTQFHHVVDVWPTVLAAAGVEAPERVNGVEQANVDGVSMEYSFADPGAASRRTTQYFEILGNRAIYHDGWVAACYHGRPPWVRFVPMPFDGPQEKWELFHVESDFSQSVDLADTHPEKLAELLALFDAEARRCNVYPLRDASPKRHPDTAVPTALGGLTKMTYNRSHVRIPESIVLNLKNCSWRITADVTVAAGDRGVVCCQGGNLAGWSLYLDEGRPTFVYNLFGQVFTTVAGDVLSAGRHIVTVEFDHDGGIGAGGTVFLSSDGAAQESARLDRTVPIMFSMSGETFDVGCDTGAPVGRYPHQFECTALIHGVTLERLTELSSADKERLAAMEFRAAMSAQ